MTTIINSPAIDADSTPDVQRQHIIDAMTRRRTFWGSLRNALVITRREMRDSFRDWRIMGPIFVLTIIFPFLAQAGTGLFVNYFENTGSDIKLLDNLLPLMPMIVGFFPISISLVIALETFVGEKERRSIEPLLSTPLTNAELYIGKALAAMIPPLLASYTGIAIYLAALVFGAQQWRPELELVIQIVVLTTAQALVMVTGAVVISGQTTSTRAANLLASFIIIPISLLVMFESFIMVTNNRYVLWYIVIGLVIVDIMLFVTGARLFNREELLGRQLDAINLTWAWRTFRAQFMGGAKNPVQWWLNTVRGVRVLRRPALVVVGTIIFMFVGGFLIAQTRPDLQIPASAVSVDGLRQNLPGVFAGFANNASSVAAVISQNTRVLLLGTLLSVMSFGVLGVIVAIVPFGVLGFLIGQPLWAEVGIGTYVAAVVLHTLVEAPAAIIASSAALRLGMTFTQTHENETTGGAFLKALADCARFGIGVVLPLLIIAALVEVYITPALVQAALG
jgi:uncharacterized membrane protein SpoIIM required for sporulation/ABC-type transport system involved in multi-copper enzyme maturation permease subunit